jgi:hypothetical protein
MRLEMETHDPTDFLRMLAPHIIAELRPPSELQKFTRNTAVVGAYVEAAVRELIRRQVYPLHVATGAVIDQENIPGDPQLPQIDTIIWSPSPAPAVFQVGDFALVPRSSAFGILEVKSSAYDPSALDLRLNSDHIRKVTADLLPTEKVDIGEFVAAGLGIICLRKKNQPQSEIDKMENANRVVVLFDETDRSLTARELDIYKLVNFLAFMRWRRRLHEGLAKINLDLLKT